MTSILITGGSGFIGSHFISFFLDQYKEYLVINLDKLTYAANDSVHKESEKNKNYIFVQGDINDEKLVSKLFNTYDFKGVIHFAAESHVDNFIENPRAFIETNVTGTFTLLDVARKHWMREPFVFKDGYEKSKFHHVSTDEVYGSLGHSGVFTETSPLSPNSPYSASKASSNLIARSFHQTYGMNVVITNSSNNYGPNQHQEKLIPTIIRNALDLKPIPIYGNGSNVRDWLFVLDHCRAIDLVFHSGQTGETYNVGGECELTNLEIAERICNVLDKWVPYKRMEIHDSFKDLITFVPDRPGHDFRYSLDCSKIRKQLNWEATEALTEGIEKTVKWYLEESL